MQVHSQSHKVELNILKEKNHSKQDTKATLAHLVQQPYV